VSPLSYQMEKVSERARERVPKKKFPPVSRGRQVLQWGDASSIQSRGVKKEGTQQGLRVRTSIAGPNNLSKRRKSYNSNVAIELYGITRWSKRGDLTRGLPKGLPGLRKTRVDQGDGRPDRSSFP